MSEQNLFNFSDICGGYGAMTVVRDIGGTVESGECLCVLGRNGVGKSTLLKILSGHLPSQSGVVTLSGRDITMLQPHERRAASMSYAPQERPVFENLTVKDNLTLMQPGENLNIYEYFFEVFTFLKARLEQRSGTLSGGERKILSFVRTMAEEGVITLLDEPTEGVQPENIARMQNLIQDARSHGRAFIIVEQHLHLAEALGDKYLVVDHGECVLSGASSKISRADILKHLEV